MVGEYDENESNKSAIGIYNKDNLSDFNIDNLNKIDESLIFNG